MRIILKPGNASIEALLKQNGIIRYNGGLIFPERGKFYVNGIAFRSIPEAEKRIDRIKSIPR